MNAVVFHISARMMIAIALPWLVSGALLGPTR